MTVSSRPQDDDAIVERKTGPLGEEKLVATKIFIQFISDLVEKFNIDSPDLSQTQSTLYQLKAELKNQLIALSNQVSAIEPNQSHENKARISAINIALNSIANSVSALQSENAQLKSAIALIQAKQAETEQRLSNLEQVAWR